MLCVEKSRRSAFEVHLTDKKILIEFLQTVIARKRNNNI